MKPTMRCAMSTIVGIVFFLDPAAVADKNEEEKTVVLEDCDAEPFAFSFVDKGKVRLPDDPKDAVEFDILLDLPHGLAANNKSVASFFKGAGGIIDMGRTPLDEVKEAPKKGYKPTLKPDQIVAGHTYCILASDGKHYGKIHVVRFNAEKGPMEFTWEYQSKDTNKFGDT